MSDRTRILVIDSDADSRAALAGCLADEGYDVEQGATGQQAIAAFEQRPPDLITLDIDVGDGFALIRRLRRMSRTPIIIVTGRSDVIDRVVGLELGADDYITKPFHPRELVARVHAVLRRTQPPDATAPPARAASDHGALCFDGVTAFPERFELLDRDGQPCDLTTGEFRLLNAFLQHPKRVLSREHLMNIVSGQDYMPLDRTIDNQVARLRKKIERDPASPKLIKTVRGVGYAFVAPLEPA